MEKNKIKLLSIIIFLLLMIGVGYTVLQANLNINGTHN